MGNDISPIALELLYSPGFFLVKEDVEHQAVHAADAQKKEPANQDMATANISVQPVQDVPEKLIFILSAPNALNPAELQMLERMAAYIRNELKIGQEWIRGGPELWEHIQGKHHWVLFGNHGIPESPDMFGFLEHRRGPLLKLPSEQVLAPDAALKKQALEALKTWGKSA